MSTSDNAAKLQLLGGELRAAEAVWRQGQRKTLVLSFPFPSLPLAFLSLLF